MVIDIYKIKIASRPKLLFAAGLLLMLFWLTLVNPVPAHASCNNQPNVTLGDYDVANYAPCNGNSNRPFINGGPGNNTVNAGDTINLNVGYTTGKDSNGNSVITWVNISESGNPGSSFLADMNAQGGKESKQDCFNLVVSNSSPYYNPDWANSAGGTFVCDPNNEPKFACGIISNSYFCPNPSQNYSRHGVGASAVWFQNSDNGGTTSRNLSLTTRGDLTSQRTFCMRVHVSITSRNANSSGYNGLTPGNASSYQFLAANGLANDRGTFGAGVNLPQSRCFTVKPHVPQPTGLCTKFELQVGTNIGNRHHGDQYNNRNTWTVVQISNVAPLVGSNPNTGQINPQTNLPYKVNGVVPGFNFNAAGEWQNTPDHKTWNYMPTNQTIHIKVWQIYRNGNGAWNLVPGSGNEYDVNCFHANCSGLNVHGDGPGGIVRAGGKIYASMSMVNNNSPWQPLPETLNTHDLGFLVVLDNNNGNTRQYSLGQGLNNGVNAGIGDQELISSAPDQGTYTVKAVPSYLGHFFLGDACQVTVNIYKPFEVSLNATQELSPSVEDPETFGYKTWVHNNNDPAIYVTTHSIAYKQGDPAIAMKDGGTYGAGDTYELNVDANSASAYKVTSPKAGDKYCVHMTSDYTKGYYAIANPSILAGQNTPGDTGEKCDTVINRPYTKTYGASVTAGGDFKLAGGSCQAPGILGGWFNNTNAANRFGTSTQYATISMSKNVGFASAQTLPSRSAVNLSFANTLSANHSSDTYSPKLGGYFGGTACMTEYETPSSADPLTSGNVSSLNGTYTKTGYHKFSGGNIAPTKRVAVYIDGDAYIDGNIKFAGANGWSSEDHIPSFLLQVKGDIYIDADVDQLDGQFIALPKCDANGICTGSHIYTCGREVSAGNYDPVSRADLFNTCKNQLTVYGSLVARKINLMRTYGSLRDEKTVQINTVLSGKQWSYFMPIAGKKCTLVNETADHDMFGLSQVWTNNYICLPAASPINFAWTHDAENDTSDPTSSIIPSGKARLDYIKTHGYPYCTKWDVPADYAATWNDNWLCSNQNIGLQFRFGDDSSKACISVDEPSDSVPDWHNAYLCENKTVSTVPSVLNCSKLPGAKVSSPRKTCAAEVFDFSPEMYLARNPSDPETPPACKVPTCGYDTIVNLPPVL